MALAVVLSRAHVTLTKRIGELDLGTTKMKKSTSLTVYTCVHRAACIKEIKQPDKQTRLNKLDETTQNRHKTRHRQNMQTEKTR